MKRLLFALLVLACSAAPCEAGLQLSIQDGKVSIDAQDVTIRQILTEWARVGKTRIVNVERLSGGPITIKFDAVPEKQALETILRAVPGYIAAPRQELVANASLYDTILIMPTTTAVAALKTPNPGYTGLQGGFPGGGANITALRPPMVPGMTPDMPDPASDQMNDPAIAAAAAAGLMPVPAMVPGPVSASAPLMMPGGIPQSSPSATPAVATPSNPWNAPVGTAQPSLAPPAPPPQPVDTNPTGRPRPPLADR